MDQGMFVWEGNSKDLTLKTCLSIYIYILWPGAVSCVYNTWCIDPLCGWRVSMV